MDGRRAAEGIQGLGPKEEVTRAKLFPEKGSSSSSRRQSIRRRPLRPLLQLLWPLLLQRERNPLQSVGETPPSALMY